MDTEGRRQLLSSTAPIAHCDPAAGIPRVCLTPEEAAASTGFSRTRIFQAIRDNDLTARKSGKATVIEIEELIRWVRALPTRGRQLAAEQAA
jgi:hypothetical protein